MSLKRFGRKLVRGAVKAAGVECPECGAQVKVPETRGTGGMEQVVQCGGCGRLASVGDLWWRRASGSQVSPSGPVEKPDGTRIVRRELPDGAVGWEVPASGRAGGLLGFGIIWLAITLPVAIGLLVGSSELKRDGGVFVMLGVAAFVLLFVAIGMGMVYFGLRNKYAKNLIMVNRTKVIQVRSLFGRKKVRSVKRDGLRWVRKQVFYEQNYEPVYGVEVRGDDGKLRFGVTLEEPEKDWLVSEIRAEAGEGTGDEIKSPAAGWKREESFIMSLPLRRGYADVAGIGFGTAISLGFVLIGVFLLEDAGFFRWVWIGFSGLFLLLSLLGMVDMVRKAGVLVEIVAGRTSVVVRRTKGGRRVKKDELPREEVKAVRVYESGSQRNRTGYRMELLTEERAVVVVRREDREGLPAFGEELQQRLGL